MVEIMFSFFNEDHNHNTKQKTQSHHMGELPSA